MKKRDFACLEDLGEGGIQAMLDRSVHFARVRGTPEHPKPLAGHATALLFDKPSTRTRLSLEVATYELGGHPIIVTPDSSQMGRGEPTEDTARVLGRGFDPVIPEIVVDRPGPFTLCEYGQEETV